MKNNTSYSFFKTLHQKVSVSAICGMGVSRNFGISAALVNMLHIWFRVQSKNKIRLFTFIMRNFCVSTLFIEIFHSHLVLLKSFVHSRRYYTSNNVLFFWMWLVNIGLILRIFCVAAAHIPLFAGNYIHSLGHDAIPIRVQLQVLSCWC